MIKTLASAPTLSRITELIDQYFAFKCFTMPSEVNVWQIHNGKNRLDNFYIEFKKNRYFFKVNRTN